MYLLECTYCMLLTGGGTRDGSTAGCGGAVGSLHTLHGHLSWGGPGGGGEKREG